MKRIISGRRYDTKTAKMVGQASYSNSTDFAYWHEELYVKRTGEYFLYGQGGPMSKYGQSVRENEWTGGKEIIPLTLEEAQAWVEKNLNGEMYEEIFGKVEENKVQVSTWLEESIKAEIDKLRNEKDFTIADIIKAGVKALKEQYKGEK